MAAARKAKADGKVVAVVALSYQGEPIPPDTDLREVLPAHVLDACVERGEAKQL